MTTSVVDRGAAARPAQTPRRAGRAASRPGRRRTVLAGWGFLAPFAILFAFCFLIPIGVSIYQSFFRGVASGGGLYGGGELVNQFVGFENYVHYATSSAFWAGMGRVFLFGIVQVPLMILSALGLALLLDSASVRRVAGFRLGYFLPYAVPGVVAALIWTYMYNPQFSPINQVLGLFGGHIDFFAPNIILWSMANMTTWTFTGYNMLIFLAALQSIPHELYEAARMEGASEWTIVWAIKVPLVRNAMLLAVLLSIIGTVQLFNEPTVLQAVNPWMGADYTPMMMAYNTMMGGLSPSGDGPASAISILMALIAGVLAVGYALLQKKAD
ncbi:carbohydrate ABC transporter permease [Tessaracoccus palaemonis]|uniref:Sugar ABC transporter permease n=1 Tax=Tessaracoccus palaemonis TaxID=2829499 RepID=A0ABX8SIZ9_9ACTN|nr:sugar ABC transporter permease [Tessaracoccus palaemonis]QXT62854.1 sugar ABC transporter permease [Tessaracoccus palaemonis]